MMYGLYLIENEGSDESAQIRLAFAGRLCNKYKSISCLKYWKKNPDISKLQHNKIIVMLGHL